MRIIVNITTSIIPRIIVGLIFLAVLIGVIAYARGYRLNKDGTLTSTGILSINSSPQPATVYVNGMLKGATDINLTLPYGQYTIEVKKEGYTDWKKSVSLKGETVMSLNAHLYSKNPSLTPLTNLGITKAIPLGNTEKVIIISQTGDVEKDGIYLFESTKRTISIFPPLTLLMLKSLLPPEVNIANATFDFDPDYRQAIITFVENETSYSYLISLDQQTTELIDISASKDNVTKKWNEEINNEMIKIVETLPKKIRSIAIDSFEVISLAPDEKRLMYLAKKDVELPLVINPPLIGANQSPQERLIKKGSIYIYDKKEDKNFKVPVDPYTEILNEIPKTEEPTTTSSTDSAIAVTPHVSDPTITRLIQEHILWFPTSDYIAIKEKNQIVLMEYDGGNKQAVYAGPFSPEFFSVSPDWNLVVIINLNPNNNLYGDLYAVGIK
ncbi:hypothetical protein BH09PAT2_BH09PAT2_05650 [soil metagenome]